LLPSLIDITLRQHERGHLPAFPSTHLVGEAASAWIFIGWGRKSMVSGLTILGIPEMEARYASYEILAEKIRYRFTWPKATLLAQAVFEPLLLL
jgi:hypothetical protein